MQQRTLTTVSPSDTVSDPRPSAKRERRLGDAWAALGERDQQNIPMQRQDTASVDVLQAAGAEPSQDEQVEAQTEQPRGRGRPKDPMSIETLRPWIADGVSRRTWFRKRAAEKAPEILPAPPKSADFTNDANAEREETAGRQAQRKKLTRVPFAVSRLMEFCTTRELVNQTGHQYREWPLVVLKELLDNALDACEEAGIAPTVSVAAGPGEIVIQDNGPGIPPETIAGILNYNNRVSSREAYVSPTRGAQGNALKTILPMSYVLDERRGDDASGITIIESRGVAHRIEFSVDHIRQEPRIVHTTTPSLVTVGTKITVLMAMKLWTNGADSFDNDIVGNCEQDFLRLAGDYVWINPHLSLKVVWDGEVKIDATASNPTWKKWLPSWPTSAHWYDKARFRRYMAAHIANRESITVREFISEI
jgi:hypothetical protein